MQQFLRSETYTNYSSGLVVVVAAVNLVKGNGSDTINWASSVLYNSAVNFKFLGENHSSPWLPHILSLNTLRRSLHSFSGCLCRLHRVPCGRVNAESSCFFLQGFLTLSLSVGNTALNLVQFFETHNCISCPRVS